MYDLRDGYWSVQTLIFYIVVMAAVFLILRPKRKNLTFNRQTYGVVSIDYGMILVFLLLLFVLGFRTSGRDINAGYYVNFLSADSISGFKDQTVEFGFILYNVVIKRLFDSYEVFIFLMALATLLPVFRFVSRNLDKEAARYAMTIYTGIYFFSGFSAARQYLSASFCLLAYDALLRRKHLRAMVWILIAASFHVSALLMFIPYLVSVFKLLSGKMIALSVVIMFAVIYLMKDSIFGMMGDRYQIYSAFASIHFGYRWIAIYIPLFYLLIRCIRFEKDKYVSRLNVSIIAMGFLFEMLGYVISILGRLSVLTIPLVYIIPHYVDVEPSPTRKKIYKLAIVLYCGLRFWLYLNDHYIDEALMPYRNLFFTLK